KLEGDAEREDQLHHQVEIFADARQQLDRHAAATGRVLKAGEESPGKRKHEIVRKRRTKNEQYWRRQQEWQQGTLLAAVQSRGHEQPELGSDHRKSDERTAEEGDLDAREKCFIKLGVDQVRVRIALFAQDLRQRFGQEEIYLAREIVGAGEADQEGNDGPQQPAPQFHQMLKQRHRLVVDRVFVAR